jgi:hypothetical protein
MMPADVARVRSPALPSIRRGRFPACICPLCWVIHLSDEDDVDTRTESPEWMASDAVFTT